MQHFNEDLFVIPQPTKILKTIKMSSVEEQKFRIMELEIFYVADYLFHYFTISS